MQIVTGFERIVAHLAVLTWNFGSRDAVTNGRTQRQRNNAGFTDPVTAAGSLAAAQALLAA
ncbi:hypothetical protein GC176_22505 [bacterium]|nr:hypothetical protein [bacterium]